MNGNVARDMSNSHVASADNTSQDYAIPSNPERKSGLVIVRRQMCFLHDKDVNIICLKASFSA